ncbi:hypothetical protein [Fibrivirga algicola]|uniref:Outer membrane protein beta-barrel domain-containing protein n=1 Tax=Fibrivirga algicola TaxID=2950420 RepID=A0ABX0QGR4_9BACT|nr:hypothetical protein [Fibrivirga algicola]NID11589.1 hypothetical protein [Fibrivirga algicola]
MEDWPDDHLDELFRKSAEEHNVPFNPDDWADMSRRLDEHDRHSLFDRISRWGGIGAVLLLLLAGLGWFTYERLPEKGNLAGGNQSGARQVVAQGPQRTTTKSAVGLGEKATESADKAVALSAGKATASTKQDHVPDAPINDLPTAGNPESQRATSIVSTPAGRETTNANAPDAARRVADRATVKQLRHRMALSKRRLVAENTVTKPMMKASGMLPAGLLGNSLRVAASAGDLPDTRGRQPVDPLADNTDQLLAATDVADATGQWMPVLMPATSLSGVVQQVRPLAEPTWVAPTADAPVRRPPPRLTGLSVMLFASPDLSGIGLENFERPGSNAGLSVQYQLTDRLSVTAGAMYSTKRYQTYASEYVWPSYMNMDVWPEEIAGVCKMVDVPLNVRYDWLLRPRGDGRAPARWFASAGLTSYFIQHEVYSYEYANPADTKIKYWGWDNKKAGRAGGSFGFSNLNISVGYERPITHRLSWQVEPFVKIPLKQVGYFKVRLLSTGAFVGLRYRL